MLEFKVYEYFKQCYVKIFSAYVVYQEWGDNYAYA